MCGFAGDIRFDNHQADFSLVKHMTQTLTPRGPDDEGFFCHEHIAFGHRRLKVMDLSDESSQPMTDEALGIVLVFNGAIYNYPDIRKTLEDKGYQFTSSHGDTEVIIKAYHAWGKDCVKHFNGMFAFVLWDKSNQTYFFARDRLGIKPLYYAKTNHAIRFASTLPALLHCKELDTSINPEALHYYMTFHSVVPAPHTILNGISKLPPGTTMTIDAHGNIQEERFWNLTFICSPEEENWSFQDWKHQLHDALLASVKRRLLADVPVGVLLSGGLDSSLIVGLLKKAGQEHVETFSVGFESTAEEEGNEFQYSDIIADAFASRHHKIYAENDNVIEHLKHCVTAMSEPMVSHDVIGFYLLSQEVSKHVKVVQSGQGADEVFAGYHWYPPMMDISNEHAAANYKKVFFDRTYEEYCNAVHPGFISKDFASAFVENHFQQPGATNPIDKTLRLDSTIMLIDDPVKRVDNMTMAWGLEARVPFLDHQLVEFAAKIPPQYKVNDGGKYILKEVARQIIPSEVIDRPKGYFPVPSLKYLDGDYLCLVKDILGSAEAKQRGIFQDNYLHELLSAPKEHITPLRGSKLWQIALLEFWLQTHLKS